MDHVHDQFMKDRFQTFAKMGTLLVLIIVTKYIYPIRKLLISFLGCVVQCRFLTFAKTGTLLVLIILTKYIYPIRKLLISFLGCVVQCRLIKPSGLSEIPVTYIFHLHRTSYLWCLNPGCYILF